MAAHFKLQMEERKQLAVGKLQFMLAHAIGLRDMASAERAPMIAYLLEMALIEIGDEMRARKKKLGLAEASIALDIAFPSKVETEEISSMGHIERLYGAADTALDSLAA
ncbi:MAG: hypothetical protein INR68_00040 [Methylobacterium mesophilicum]|nr:hypothetical protein [Methylobacterium mesophilicum]